MTEIEGRVAVVTGGGSGIGYGIAQALAEAGASVVIADIETDAAEAAATALGATPFTVDVSSMASVESLREFVLTEFGRVDIVCLNAGVGPSGLVRDLRIVDWEWILGVNLWGVIHGISAFLPLLEANENGGHIQVTGSNSSFVSLPTLGSYNVAKFGVAALLETLAVELAEADSNVRVSLLAPGPVRTNIKNSSRNRPKDLVGSLQDVDITDGLAKGMRWIDPITAGRIAVRSIRNEDLYAPTHPDMWAPIEARHEAIRRAYRKYPVWEDGE